MIYCGEVLNLDLIFLVSMSPQATVIGEGGHRTRDNCFFWDSVHTSKTPLWTYQPVILFHANSSQMNVIISALCVSSLLFTESLSSLTFMRCFGRSAFQNIPTHRGCCISVPTEILALTYRYFIFYLAGHESLLKWMTGSSIRETGEEQH